MPAANARADAAINRRSGFTVDFSDFVIAITLGQTASVRHISYKCVSMGVRALGGVALQKSKNLRGAEFFLALP
jgi:hypothetical protein